VEEEVNETDQWIKIKRRSNAVAELSLAVASPPLNVPPEPVLLGLFDNQTRV
jgi:hypothetical protein